MRRRAVRTAILAALILVLLWVGVVSFQILRPAQGTGARADAVISLAPSHDRLFAAERIFEMGQADNLVISWFASELEAEIAWNTPSPAARFCVEGQERAGEERVFCMTPEESDTLGEALAMRALAEEHGWTSITVVTSRYHAFRAGFVFHRCMPPETEVQVIYTEPSLTIGWWLHHVAYENAAFVKAIIETAGRC